MAIANNHEISQYYRLPDSEPDAELAAACTARRYGDIHYSINPENPEEGTINCYMGHDDYLITLPGKVPSVDGESTVALTNVAAGVFNSMTAEYYDVVFEEGISILEGPANTSWRHLHLRHATLPESMADLNNFFESGYGNTGLLESPPVCSFWKRMPLRATPSCTP